MSPPLPESKQTAAALSRSAPPWERQGYLDVMWHFPPCLAHSLQPSWELRTSWCYCSDVKLSLCLESVSSGRSLTFMVHLFAVIYRQKNLQSRKEVMQRPRSLHHLQ